jgi:hypothetical protein
MVTWSFLWRMERASKVINGLISERLFDRQEIVNYVSRVRGNDPIYLNIHVLG